MKRMLGMVGLMVVMAGCASGPALDMNKVAEKFYGQQRAVEVVKLTNVDAITVTGKGMSVVVQNEMTPLSIMPRDPSTAEALIGAAERTLTVGAGIVTAGQVMKQMAGQPRVVETRPEVVRPEIVTVPAQ